MILKHVIFLNGVRMYICRDDSTSVKTILINVQVTDVTISKTHVKMFINDTFIFFSEISEISLAKLAKTSHDI